ncbi:MAG: NAD(P)H-dependent oxidoreductase [Puniceicoccaceae bacterium]|nr:MAG: NAD(P)H-dependent oxidoreductase [Puniceicoccaceae bacterium]
MPNVLIFGTSLDPNSKSQVLAREVAQRLAATPTPHALVDLRTLQLPESGRPGATDHPEVAALRNQVSRATHLVFAVAIYNYSVSSAAKNLVELLTDEVMNDKVVGFLCAAGGRGS